MSHNIDKVNSIEPDETSSVSQSLANLITVTNPVDGEFLSKSASGWETSDVSSNTPNALFGMNSWNVSLSVGSQYVYSQGDNYIFYRYKANLNDLTMVNASGLYVPVANSSWFMALTLDGSTYNGKTILLEATIAPSSNFTNRSGTVQFMDNYRPNSANALGPKANLYGRGHSDRLYGKFTGTGVTKHIAIEFIPTTQSSFRLSGTGVHCAENFIIREIG